MPDDSQIREKLAKSKALFAGATTPGERQVAQAAVNRVQQRMDGIPQPQVAVDPPMEFHFSLINPWSLRLFLALARSKGLKPYRWCHQSRDSQNDAGIWAMVRAAGEASADAVPPAGLAVGARPAASTRPAPFKRSAGEDHASKRWSGVWGFSKARAI